MKINTLKLNDTDYPDVLRQIPSPPEQLYVIGADLSELLAGSSVAIVGSRKITAYGRDVTMKLASELAKRGIVIISGLALGVDGVAHRAALEAGGKTIAVLPGSLDKIYPASHRGLAKQILDTGGALVSEYPAGTDIYIPNFVARNRIVSGLADALLITEAAEKSGSLHTARFALSQGKDVLAVPGNITSVTSTGTNNLIKSGALPITDYGDVLFALGLQDNKSAAPRQGRNEQEQILLDLIFSGVRDGDELLVGSALDIALFNQTLTMLELTGKIRSLGANQWGIN